MTSRLNLIAILFLFPLGGSWISCETSNNAVGDSSQIIEDKSKGDASVEVLIDSDNDTDSVLAYRPYHAGFKISGIASPAMQWIPQDITVTAVDQFGDTVEDYTGTVDFASSAGITTILPSSMTFEAVDNGTKTLPGAVIFQQATSHMITVRDLSDFSLSGTSAVIEVIPFSPTDISDSILWLDASDGASMTESDGKVSQWRDKSGAGDAIQSDTVQMPSRVPGVLNGRAVVRFDSASSQWLSVDLSELQDNEYSIFAVSARHNNQGHSIILGSTNEAIENGVIHFGWRADNSFTMAQYANDLDITIPNFATDGNDFALVHAQLSSEGHELNFANLNPARNDNIEPLSNCANGTIGNYQNSNYFKGDIAEIIVYKRALTPLEIERVKLYLAEKWGLPYHGKNLGVFAPWMSLFSIPNRVALLSSNTGKDDYLTSMNSTVRLWVDASDATSVKHTSNIVDSWLDKSGQKNHLRGINGPVYAASEMDGKGAILLEGAEDYLALDVAGFTASHIFSLHRFSSSSPDNTAIISNGANGKRHVGRCGSSDNYCGNHLGGKDNFTYLGGTFRVNGLVENAIGYDTYELISAVSPTPKDFDTLWVGETIDAPTHNWNGAIAELIVFGDALSDTQQIVMEQYFRQKWYNPSSPTQTVPYFTELLPFQEKIRAGWQPGGDKEAGYLLLRSELPILERPIDGKTYNAGDKIGDMTVVYRGAQLFAMDENISFGETYHYALFSYNEENRYSRSVTRTIDARPPYSPNGMMLWLDGADTATLYHDPSCNEELVTRNGENVSCWKDKSGNNHHAVNQDLGQTPTYQKEHLNSKGVLRFDGKNDHFADIFAANTKNKTIFVVFSHDHDGKGDPTGPLYQNNNVSDSGFFPMYANGLSPLFTNTWTQEPSEFGRNTYHVVTVRHGDAISQLYKNGYKTMEAAANATHTGGYFQIGSRRANNQYFRGEIAELLYYNRDLTDTERKTIETYLMDKWGRSPSVPQENLVLWLDSATRSTLYQTVDGLEMPVTGPGQKVLTWKDRSGNEHNARLTSIGTDAPEYSIQALGGKPCILFDGNDDYMEGSLRLGTDAATLVILHNRLTVDNRDRVFSAYTSSEGLTADWNSANGFALSHEGFSRNLKAANGFEIDNPSTRDTWYLDIIEMGGGTGSFWRNGVLEGTDDYSMNTGIGADTFRLSQGSDGISNGNNMVCEVLLFNKKLTVTERLAIQEYIFQKWTRSPSKPAKPEYVSLAAFDDEILSRWLPGGGNETEYLLVRGLGKPATWSPKNGSIYTVANIDFNQRIVYAGSKTSVIDDEVSENETYYYTLYAKDSSHNYSPPSLRQITLRGIPGLTVRLEASSIDGTAGDPVHTWPDLAGANHAIQENADKQPILQACANDLPCVTFDGIDDELALGNLGDQFPEEASFYVVAWPYDDPHYNLFYNSNSTDTWWRYHGNGFSYPAIFRSTRIENYGSIVMPSNGPALWAGHSNATNWQMWVSGRDLGSAGAAYFSGDNFGIGGPDNGNASKFLRGAIFEILLFNRTLTEEEKAAMDDYFRGKYGLKIAGAWW